MGRGWSLNLGTRWEDHSDFGADFTSHIGLNKELSAATNAFVSWGQAVNNPTLKMRYANTQ
jgi:vitamin B12 transporter